MPTIVVCFGEFRVKANCLAVIRDGLVWLALVGVDPAAIVIGFGKFWIETDGLREIGEPVGDPPLAMKPDPRLQYAQ